MKRRSKPHSENLPPVKLYLGDIERIVEILGELSSDVKVLAEEYSLSDVSELTKLDQQALTQLEIEIRSPHISLEMSPYAVRLYIGEDTAESWGVFTKIKDLMHSRKRRLLAWLGTWAPTLPAMLAILSLFGAAVGVGAGDWALTVVAVCLLVVSVWMVKWTQTRILKKYSLIILKRRDQQQPWWDRNRDQLTVGLIVGVILALVGAAIALLARHLTGSTP